MLTKIYKKIALVVFAIVLTGCANSDFSHSYLMRGQVVSASPDNIVVCLGLDDGAKVGQELVAYRFVENHNQNEGASGFVKRTIGKVRVEKIIDEHFAKVTVLTGEIKKSDMVQLNK
jgi:major membrane immunogen (membrane-anchored lipoprotein)